MSPEIAKTELETAVERRRNFAPLFPTLTRVKLL